MYISFLIFSFCRFLKHDEKIVSEFKFNLKLIKLVLFLYFDVLSERIGGEKLLAHPVLSRRIMLIWIFKWLSCWTLVCFRGRNFKIFCLSLSLWALHPHLHFAESLNIRYTLAPRYLFSNSFLRHPFPSSDKQDDWSSFSTVFSSSSSSFPLFRRSRDSFCVSKLFLDVPTFVQREIRRDNAEKNKRSNVLRGCQL